jgi:hypothetical protein
MASARGPILAVAGRLLSRFCIALKGVNTQKKAMLTNSRFAT